MADCGVAARRKCEEIIREGRVSVNDCVVTEMGFLVNDQDCVKLDGNIITPQPEKVYIIYNKPIGEITAVSDDKGRETVMDHFRDFPVRLYPVGRLDYDSEGLLLLTNDGDLAQRMSHPSCEVDKAYLVRVSGTMSQTELDSLRRGLYMDGDERRTWPSKVKVIRSGDIWSELLITIHEGRNRQVRRMIAAVGHSVIALKRVRFGPLELGGLRRGEWRVLQGEELKRLQAL